MVKKGSKKYKNNKRLNNNSKKITKWILFSLLGLFLISVIVLGIYFSLNFTSEEEEGVKVITLGSGLESVVLSADGQNALVKLNSSINSSVSKIKFAFKVNGTSIFYEMNRSASWNNSLNNSFNLVAGYFNLTDFKKVTNVSVIFVYTQSTTSTNKNTKKTDSSTKKEDTTETPAAGCKSTNVTDDYSCDGGDVYWYDNCDTKKAIKQDCNSSQDCVDDQCVNKCIANNFTNSSG